MASSNSMNMDEAGVQTYSTTTGNLTGSATTQYNVIVGDANNKLANVAPSATSGVPLISSGSSANPAFGTAVVAGGGTGNTTFTAYSVIAAGTTATGAFQNVSGVGTSGQILISNGAGALPTWQTASGSGNLNFQYLIDAANPADGVTYYCRDGTGLTVETSSTAATRFYIPVSGTITKAYGAIRCTAGSSESVTLAIRLNNSSNTNISTSINLSSTLVTVTNTGLSISVSAGDYINLLFIAPTWVTNPTNVGVSMSIFMTT